MPSSELLPNESDFDPRGGGLDEQSAWRHFGGLTLDEAREKLSENSLYYQEDFMFMGPRAFRYYVPAIINYIQSETSTGDADIINCFASILTFRLEIEAAELVAVAPLLVSVCRYIVEHFDRFDAPPESYGDLRLRFRRLERAFAKQMRA